MYNGERHLPQALSGLLTQDSADSYQLRRLHRYLQPLRDRSDAVPAFTSATEIDSSRATMSRWGSRCGVVRNDAIVRLTDLLRLGHDCSRYFCGPYRRKVVLDTGLPSQVKNSVAILIAEPASQEPFVDIRDIHDEGLSYLRSILSARLSLRQRSGALRALSRWLVGNVTRALIEIGRSAAPTNSIRRSL